MKVFEGPVWKFGDDISTDLLMPGRSLHSKISASEVKYFCMEAERPDFSKKVKSGDIIVAGRNFGCGSSRPAMQNLVALGVSCVVAESVTTLFFRNSISVAFPILICIGVTGVFEEGDLARVTLATGEVRNMTKGISLQGEPYPPFLLHVVEEGGILEIFRKGKRLTEMM